MVGDLHVGTLASTMVVGRNYIYTSLDVPMKLIYKISIHTFPVVKTIFFFLDSLFYDIKKIFL